MKAKVGYKDGLRLTMPKFGLAPMLFMEWLAERNAPLSIVHKVIDDVKGECFHVRMNVGREEYARVRDYINANLGE